MILAAGALACDLDRSAGPAISGPLAEMIEYPSIMRTLSPTTSVDEPPPDTVVYYPDSTLVKVEATGLLEVYRSQAEGWDTTAGWYVGPSDAGGKLGGDGTRTANVVVAFSMTGVVGFGDEEVNAPTQEYWIEHAVVRGYGTVGRNRGPSSPETFCDGPGEPPCHGLTGSHTITITPEPVEFTVTATPTTVNYADTVTVTASVTPGQVAGLNVPLKLDSVTWVPDTLGSQPNPCLPQFFTATAPGTLVCRKPFTRPGTLTVYATVQGVKAQQAVAITVTPPKLTVTANPPSMAGPQSVTFTASLTPSTLAWNMWAWHWRPDSGGGGISPDICYWTEKTCTRTISKSGWQKGEVRIGEYVLFDSARVYVGPVAIGVACAGSGALRGSIVSCEARPQPVTESLAVATWVFTSTTGDVVTRQSNASNPTWVGPLVVDGRIDVTGTVGGRSATGTTTVAVTARDWSQRTVHHVVQEQWPNNLPSLPTQPADLGNHAGFAQAYLPQNGCLQISEGPNEGYFYFTDVPVDALSRIQINRVALASGSAFYNQQPVSAPAGQCTQADVVPFLPLAEDHEGLTLSPSSHAGVLRNELNRLVPQATEHVTALNNLTLLIDRADSAAAPGITAARNAARDQINGGTVPPIPYCSFTY